MALVIEICLNAYSLQLAAHSSWCKVRCWLLAQERCLIEMYHTELLRCNPSLVGEYSLEQLLDEVKMVWASYLIGMLLDEDGKAEQRAQDFISRQGPDLTKPRVDGTLQVTLLGHDINDTCISMEN
eukprot:COSAG02_NODE_6068_length_3827_cov_1.089056_4_plen_126_part_00